MRELPSQEVLQELLRYEPETGRLFWKHRLDHYFDHYRNPHLAADAWNKKYAGKETFRTLGRGGHRQGCILSKFYLAHRVVFTLVFGFAPTNIDHINGRGGDNRIENLRDGSAGENQKNLAKQKRNTSGVTGVYWHKASNKWQARIGIDRGFSHLGTFASYDDAVEARKKAERQYGFHENHGREAA